MIPNLMYLFGGDKPWDATQFTASDDRVRGGASQSYLTALSGGSRAAQFSGNLDITALGGAGFASQRTVDGAPGWDLSGFDTMVLDVARADGRRYTLTLKDEVLPRRPDGREQSTVSWEYDFVAGGAGGAGAAGGAGKVVVPFDEFRPTYRGKPRPNAEPLDLRNVKRFSFMMRSFFGDQQGDFSIVFNSVAVEARGGKPRQSSLDSVADAKLAHEVHSAHNKGNDTGSFGSWIGKLCGWPR